MEVLLHEEARRAVDIADILGIIRNNDLDHVSDITLAITELNNLSCALRELNHEIDVVDGKVSRSFMDDLNLIQQSVAFTLEGVWSILGKLPQQPTATDYENSWKEVCRYCLDLGKQSLHMQLAIYKSFLFALCKVLKRQTFSRPQIDDLRHGVSKLQSLQREYRQRITSTEGFASLSSVPIQQSKYNPPIHFQHEANLRTVNILQLRSQERIRPQKPPPSFTSTPISANSLAHQVVPNPLAVAQEEQTSNIGIDKAERSQQKTSSGLQSWRRANNFRYINLDFETITGNREVVLALQDTGADTNIITETVANALGFKVTPLAEDDEAGVVRGLGGEPLRPQGFVNLRFRKLFDLPYLRALETFYVYKDHELVGHEAILSLGLVDKLGHLERFPCINCMEATEETTISPDQRAGGCDPSPFPRALSNQPNRIISTVASSESSLSHDSLPALTNAKFDSGYGSMPEAVSKTPEQDDDNRSIRSILTNASRVIIPPEEEDHLISAFVGDLCHDISFAGDLDDVRRRTSAWLPNLLKVYTLRLEDTVNSRTERDAKEFIRQQRNRISYQFSQGQMPVDMSSDVDQSPPAQDGMSLDEKMALWTTTERPDNEWEAGRIDPGLEEAQVPPRYQEVRPFLLDGPAYQWLLKNARSSALLTERTKPVLELAKRINDALSSIGTSKSPQPRVFQASISMDWDLPNFLNDQRYETTMEIAIERAITVTGSFSNAQTLTCIDYMCQTWPSSGREVVRMIQNALTSPNLSFSSGLDDGTKLDINFKSPKASIIALGCQAALAELVEQLAWLGAALRTSPVPVGICIATPSITTSEEVISDGEVPSLAVQLGFTITPLPEHSLSADVVGNCWHAMFRNPMVADGFPILARHENEQGLEVSLGIMSVLAEAQFATRYDTTLVLKGPCTMLVPTRRTQRSVTWHFLLNESGTRIPHFSFRERCPGWIGTDKVNIKLLEAGDIRHFVGWVPSITRHLGTEEVKYNEINWAGARKCSPGLAIEQKLTISFSKLLGGSVNAVRGIRDKPEFFKHSGYSIQIKNARNLYVVLYDVGAQRGWLVDGASALLHLVRTQVVREPYGGAGSLFNNLRFNRSRFEHPTVDGGPDVAADILMEANNMKHIILREFSAWADETIPVRRHEEMSTIGEESNDDSDKPSQKAPSSSEDRKEIYKTICLRELISQTCNTLEHIYDRQIEVATTHAMTQLTNPLRTKLEGYEFMDIVSARPILTRRAIDLQSNGAVWTVLTKQIHAIALFGQHFGEIYKPIETTKEYICTDWRTVPRGQEYLAVPVSLLKEIKHRSWEEGEVDADSPEIAEGFLCHPSRDVFRTCGPSCKHSFDRVQRLRSSKPTEVLNRISMGGKGAKNVDTFTEINGAILFGKNSNLDVTRLEHSSPPAVHKEPSFHDSGIGSSLHAPSHASSSFASPIDMSVSSQPSGPPADITGTPPFPFNQHGGKSATSSRDGAEARDTTSPAEFASSASCASAKPGLVAVPIPDNNIMVRDTSPSHEDIISADVPDLDNRGRRRRNFIAGLTNIAKMKPFRGK